MDANQTRNASLHVGASGFNLRHLSACAMSSISGCVSLVRQRRQRVNRVSRYTLYCNNMTLPR